MFSAYFSSRNKTVPNVSQCFLAAMSPLDDNPSGQTRFGKNWLVATHETIENSVQIATLDGGCTVLFWGRLESLKDLCVALSLQCPSNITGLIYAAWKKWGMDFANHLTGDFAIILHFEHENKIILLRDALGIRPLFYHLTQDALICATTPKSILNVIGDTLLKNKRWIAKYLLDPFYSVDDTETAYQSLVKVAPGHILEITNGKVVSSHKWHHWANTPEKSTKLDLKWPALHHKKFTHAVMARVPENAILCESTAGIDSSSIISVLAAEFTPHQKDRLFCYGHVESPLSKQLITQLSADKGTLETRLSDDQSDDSGYSKSDLRIMGYPIAHGCYIPPALLSEYHTKHRVDVVFSGFGGDEVASNFANGLGRELYDSKNYIQLYKLQKGNPIAKILRTVKRIYCFWTNRETTPHSEFEQILTSSILCIDAVKKYDLINYLKQNNCGNSSNSHINDHIIGNELNSPNIANRLECHTIFGNAFGVEFRWPFWDVDLIQNYLNTPSIEKYGPNATTRYLHKRAMDGLVPDYINWRTSKDLECVTGNNREWRDDIPWMKETVDRTLATWHQDLDTFVDREKLAQDFSKTNAATMNYATYVKYATSTSALANINDWLNTAT